MPATVSQISAALKTALAGISGLRVYDYQPDQLNPPLAIVGVNQVNYHQAFRGGDAVHQYLVTIVVSRPSERTGQNLLDGFTSYSGASSVRSAIETDPTLGGVVDAAVVERAENVQYVSIADNTYLSVDFVVTVPP